MAQNQAHMGDIVAISVGDLKGQKGTIVALTLRANDNRCMVRIAPDDDQNAPVDYAYDGDELKLIDCHHMGIITGE